MKETKNTQSLDLMVQAAGKAELLLKQLANSNRLLVLCQLVEGEKTVSELSESVGLSQSALSQHLSKMREAGLLAAEKRGQMVYYHLSSMEAKTIISMLYFMFCNKR